LEGFNPFLVIEFHIWFWLYFGLSFCHDFLGRCESEGVKDKAAKALKSWERASLSGGLGKSRDTLFGCVCLHLLLTISITTHTQMPKREWKWCRCSPSCYKWLGYEVRQQHYRRANVNEMRDSDFGSDIDIGDSSDGDEDDSSNSNEAVPTANHLSSVQTCPISNANCPILVKSSHPDTAYSDESDSPDESSSDESEGILRCIVHAHGD
jgi:hypothetical protein